VKPKEPFALLIERIHKANFPAKLKSKNTIAIGREFHSGKWVPGLNDGVFIGSQKHLSVKNLGYKLAVDPQIDALKYQLKLG
jgi:hypothetical protein